MTEQTIVPIRGFLIHLTHYDPRWYERKAREKPFDLDLGLEVVDAMAEVGLNLLVIDCADGVRYRSHPELARPYSVPMAHLEHLVQRAEERGLEVVPKLNFSQSHLHRHNDWFRPYHYLFDNDEYWRLAFELVDELLQVCRPRRYFHVGMDEDHDRAHSQYVEAILTLHSGLQERGLRTIIWNDSAHKERALVHAEKSLVAEQQIPRDVVQAVWDYSSARPDIVRRLVQAGFEVWGAPGQEPDQARQWRQAILQHGGRGLLMTNWIPCRRPNRAKFLRLIRTVGPLY
jgi:hypothetical protein